MCSEVARRLGHLPRDVQTAYDFCDISLASEWEDMNGTEHEELERAYNQLTGRDLRKDLYLPVLNRPVDPVDDDRLRGVDRRHGLLPTAGGRE
jgi:hypothetical protein